MSLKTAGVFAGIAATALNCATAAHALEWSDTSLNYRWGSQFREPYNDKKIEKNIIGITHVDGYKYGTNFLAIDLLNSNSVDSNAMEAYVVYRNTVDLGKVTGSKSFAFGPVRGVGITGGFDWNTKNDPGYASKKRMLVLGPTLKMDVPGFLDISLLLLNESNKPVGVDNRYTYRTHPMINVAWGIPVGDTNFSFEGYALYIAAKGTNEFGGPTSPETHVDATLMYDAGMAMGMGKNVFRVGLEYEYWRNKFGNPHSVTGSLAKTPMVRAEYHF